MATQDISATMLTKDVGSCVETYFNDDEIHIGELQKKLEGLYAIHATIQEIIEALVVLSKEGKIQVSTLGVHVFFKLVQ